MSWKKITKYTIKITVIFILFLVTSIFFSNNAYASGEVATYTAVDGFKVVSYSKAWSDKTKLKAVYEELLRNGHGEEFKLLSKISIYPGQDPQGMLAAGRWYGAWKMEKSNPRLSPNRYIDIYNGDNLTTVDGIARILSHEYGHHFTYYYFYKKENRQWDDWRTSELANARNLKNNPKVSHSGVEHKWLVQEIVAEDYVQIFGSPSAKQSFRFKDIEERLQISKSTVSYSNDMFNYQPQENYELPLATSNYKIKEYWLKASGLPDNIGTPPAQVSLRLESVNQFSGVEVPQYTLSWNKSHDDRTTILEYTLVCFDKSGVNKVNTYPIKTVYDNEPLKAVIGSAHSSRLFVWEQVPSGLAYFVVYVKDGDGLITASQILAVDFARPLNPESVLIDDFSLLSGTWLPPKVKIDQKQINFDVPPLIKDGRTLVPLRAVFEELGASVEWEEATQTVKATRGEINMILQVGNNSAIINGEHCYLDVAPQVNQGRTLIPLRFVSEALGAKVSWNQTLQLASISY